MFSIKKVDYPSDIHKALYTTNAIKLLNSVTRKSLKKRKLFTWLLSKPRKMDDDNKTLENGLESIYD